MYFEINLSQINPPRSPRLCGKPLRQITRALELQLALDWLPFLQDNNQR